jgi:hypothetical protein
MNAGDKILLVAGIVFGGAAGYAAFGSALGVGFGLFAGIAVIGLSLWIGDEINVALRNHYRKI